MKTALSAKVGKKIKEKRLELKLTIHEVSNEINLTEKFLKAIENGDYSIFPAKAFARGYFVKYTTHLGLDLEFPELANEVFEEDKLAQPNQSAKHVKAKSITDVIESYKKPLLVAGIILFLLLIVSVLARSSSDESQIKLSSDEFHYHEVWTYLYALFLTVALIEWWGAKIRKTLNANLN